MANGEKKRFVDRVAIITGASEGVGADVARKLAREGANVVLAARRKAPLEKMAEEIEGMGGTALIVPTDVGQTEQCQRLIEAAIDRFGAFHILVNNAGLHRRGMFDSIEADAVAAMVDVNLRAPLLLTALALPELKKVDRGVVVNVASLAGMLPLAEAAVYSSTKFGLRAFSLALAQELEDSTVDVCVVSPGPIETSFIINESIDNVSDMVFSQPMSTSDEVAQLIVDCAADGRPERTIPKASGYLATAGYLMPSLRKMLKPMLKRKGARVKARYKRLRETGGAAEE